MSLSDFDIALKEGQIREQKLSSILSGTIEVKTDFLVDQTGNVVIEYECRGKPSGISVTRADWWAIILDGDEAYNEEIVVLIKTERLKKIARRRFSMGCTTSGGDRDNSSDGVAKLVKIPVFELLSRDV